MQEEVEQRVVTLVVDCAKLTEQELRKALAKMLEKLKAQKQGKQPHGKMTVKQLAAQNKLMQCIEVPDKNIGSFTKIARKYGIDFAPFKAKAQDTDAMTAAFQEYTAKVVKKKERPSILEKLAQFKALIKAAVVDRTKKKELER